MNKSVFPAKYGLVLSVAGAALLLLAALLLVATAQSAGGRAGKNDEGLSANPPSHRPQSVESLSTEGVPAGSFQAQAEAAFRSSPVMFIENVGQFDDRARFQVRGATGTIWLAEDAIWITTLEPPPQSSPTLLGKELRGLPLANEEENKHRRGVNLKLTFPGANSHPRIEPFDRLDTKVSYFIGSDPDEWHPDVPVWAGVRYVDLYPGVDLEITSQSGRWSWQVVADAGTALSEVRLRVEGADDLALDGHRLRLTTAVGELALPLPTTDLALQVEGITSDSQPTTFHLRRVLPSEAADDQQWTAEGLAVDRQSSAVIQDNPGDLLYSTFLGGSDRDSGGAIAVDGVGSAYVTGGTQSADFPTTPGAFHTTLNGSDAFVIKVNAGGTGLVYATFLGGNGDDVSLGIDVDGNAYLAGYTSSEGFPTTVGAFDTIYHGGSDVFVAKLNATGDALVYATLLGGDDVDWGFDMDLNGDGEAYITGITYSSDFPTTSGVLDTSLDGYNDTFIAKLNADGSGLIYATLLGGSDGVIGWSIAVDNLDSAYVAGSLSSSSGFAATEGAYDNSVDGFRDAFVAKLNATGSSLVYATFLGGSESEHALAIAVDTAGNAFVTGKTESADFPTTVEAFDTTYNGGGNDAFVAKFNAIGSSLVYASFLGGDEQDVGRSIAIDHFGNAYVIGSTESADFPTAAGAFAPSFGGGICWSYNCPDAFSAKLNSRGTNLVYATFIGGSGSDSGYSVAVDGMGVSYVTGRTNSSDFPITTQAYDTSHNGDYDAFIVELVMRDTMGPFTVTISPIYPATHTMSSTVMQGGTIYRHFRLLDGGGTPVPDATVTFSVGDPATTDAQGYFTYTISADTLGGPGSTYPVTVQSVTYHDQTYTIDNQPTFNVEVTERSYSHTWEYGAVRRGAAGISSGLVAYFKGETSGGLALSLEESDPTLTSDDQVTMDMRYATEGGFVLGAGADLSVKAGVTKIIFLGDHLLGEFLLRQEGEVGSVFTAPYTSSHDRAGQALYVLASAADALNTLGPPIRPPDHPLLVRLLQSGLSTLDLPYDHVAAGSGGHLSAEGAIQFISIESILRVGDRGSTLGFDLTNFSGDETVLKTLTDYGDEVSLAYSLNIEMETSGFALPLAGKLFGDNVGVIAQGFREEVFFDKVSGDVRRVEISLTGVGNPQKFTDVLLDSTTTKVTVPGNQLTPEVLQAAPNLNQLIASYQSGGVGHVKAQALPLVSEFDGLLGNVGWAEYEVTVADGADADLVPELGWEGGLKIELGQGLTVKESRTLVRERGVLLNDHWYRTQSHTASGCECAPGKGWWDLTSNALGGLWDLVKHFFSWAREQVMPGAGWVLDVVARTESDNVRGGAQITAPSGTQLFTTGPGPQAVTVHQTEPITVTALGWVPTSTEGMGNLSLSPAMGTASGGGFVVGGVYEFSPYNLTLNPAATLVITYTDEAATGVNESRIGLFHWNPEGNNWQPMAAQADLVNNAFTANITQLGTFALGYDGTPPEVSILAPTDGSVIANALPLISALVVDTGVGVDPTTVQMRLDGQVVPADYMAGTGQLLYLPATPLADGPHTVTVSAADVVGNLASTTASFQVEIHRVYLPLVQRDR